LDRSFSPASAGKSISHPGNKRLRALAELWKNQYQSVRSSEKARFAKSILDGWRIGTNPQGRFLRKVDGAWRTLTEEAAVKVIMGILRREPNEALLSTPLAATAGEVVTVFPASVDAGTPPRPTQSQLPPPPLLPIASPDGAPARPNVSVHRQTVPCPNPPVVAADMAVREVIPANPLEVDEELSEAASLELEAFAAEPALLFNDYLRQFSSGVSSNGGGFGISAAGRGSRSMHDDDDADGGSSAGNKAERTPLFERLVTEEVQELKAAFPLGLEIQREGRKFTGGTGQTFGRVPARVSAVESSRNANEAFAAEPALKSFPLVPRQIRRVGPKSTTGPTLGSLPARVPAVESPRTANEPSFLRRSLPSFASQVKSWVTKLVFGRRGKLD
jgi:hypothetical protein